MKESWPTGSHRNVVLIRETQIATVPARLCSYQPADESAVTPAAAAVRSVNRRDRDDGCGAIVDVGAVRGDGVVDDVGDDAQEQRKKESSRIRTKSR